MKQSFYDIFDIYALNHIIFLGVSHILEGLLHIQLVELKTSHTCNTFYWPLYGYYMATTWLLYGFLIINGILASWIPGTYPQAHFGTFRQNVAIYALF